MQARRRAPLVNWALMTACGLVFGFELSLGPEAGAFIRRYGFVPWDLTAALRSGPQAWGPVALDLLSSMFVHGGWLHVIGNLLYLRVFGDNVEDRLGRLGYLVFYLAAGVTGASAQYLTDPDSTTPMVGASGAIAGVLGAYVVLFPRARVVTLFPVFIFLTFIEVPAVFFVGIWAIQQLLYGWMALEGNASAADVAWFAHLGGFVVGLVVGTFRRFRRN
ncbi:MAG TPA: rhomboid family intramembrane serine protease [Myxococcales bacterium LLY-WYZ-16_1]|nr:rhomboid family intramembrane serine protease [Myxococcales bacterium LLY-WYZ-16_1]